MLQNIALVLIILAACWYLRQPLKWAIGLTLLAAFALANAAAVILVAIIWSGLAVFKKV